MTCVILAWGLSFIRVNYDNVNDNDNKDVNDNVK